MVSWAEEEWSPIYDASSTINFSFLHDSKYSKEDRNMDGFIKEKVILAGRSERKLRPGAYIAMKS